jgi:RimJ/RimL family protein N-acetyltransferase
MRHVADLSTPMANHEPAVRGFNWRIELPVLSGRLVTLREPTPVDCDSLLALLSEPDATRFDLDGSPGPGSVHRLIDRVTRDRAAGVAFMYVITFAATGQVIGLLQVRQLDPLFESAAWECTVLSDVRGTGVFWEAAHLVGSFVFASAGASRLEARIDIGNGRGNAAIRKMGGVAEGVLRRSGRRGHEFVDQMLWAVLKDAWDFDADPPVVVVH